ncbi:hypothetical protein Droror1_Dr00027780 [Drosera rotundifolia]
MKKKETQVRSKVKVNDQGTVRELCDGSLKELEQESDEVANFGFVFDDSNFSDRVPGIEIMAGESDSRAEKRRD